MLIVNFFILGIFSDIYAQIPSQGSEVWLDWFGKYHFVFLHFPIVLVFMACFAEFLLYWTRDTQYNFLVNFLLFSAAIFIIPTVLSGLSLEESGYVSETSLFEWHKIFGFLTLAFMFITILLRYYKRHSFLYFLSLLLLLVCVMVTSHLGGLMVFESFNILPPILEPVQNLFGK